MDVIGLRREREVLTVALQTDRHVVLEGPPGTGKSTLLRSIAADVGTEVVFVEGNAELTPARLVGQYDPSAVMTDGYVPTSFTDGPLLTAMRGSGLLYLEELNRIPEETLNVLITVLTEGEIAVPRLGRVHAAAGFRLIAAMNPFDAIGTARVGQAIADRMCRVVLGYQDADAERAIVAQVTGADAPLIALAVALVRATREHRDLRTGSSVRGAIDLVLLLDGLLRMRGARSCADGPGDRPGRRARRAVRAGSRSWTASTGRRSRCSTRSWTTSGRRTRRHRRSPTSGADEDRDPGKAEGPQAQQPAGPDSAELRRGATARRPSAARVDRPPGDAAPARGLRPRSAPRWASSTRTPSPS